jgi:hypothetical protein
MLRLVAAVREETGKSRLVIYVLFIKGTEIAFYIPRLFDV